MKSFFSLIVLFFLAQSVYTSILPDIKSEVESLVVKIEAAVVEAESAIETYSDEASAYLESYTTEVLTVIGNLTYDVENAVACVVNTSETAVTTCAEEYKVQAVEVLEDATSGILSCAITTFENSVAPISTLKELYSNTTTLLESIKTEVAECDAKSTKLKKAKCFAELIAVDGVTATKLILQISTIASKLPTTIPTIPLQLQTCGTLLLAKVSVEVALVVAKIGLCTVVTEVTTLF